MAAKDNKLTMEDLFERYSYLTPKLLERECSIGHLHQIALSLRSWELLGQHLGLTSADIEDIKASNNSEETKRHNMLLKWQNSLSFKATYQKLLDALLNTKNADLATEVCELLVPSGILKKLEMLNKLLKEIEVSVSDIGREQGLELASNLKLVANKIEGFYKDEPSIATPLQQEAVTPLRPPPVPTIPMDMLTPPMELESQPTEPTEPALQANQPATLSVNHSQEDAGLSTPKCKRSKLTESDEKKFDKEFEHFVNTIQPIKPTQVSLSFNGNQADKDRLKEVKDKLKTASKSSITSNRMIFHYMAFATIDRLECDHCKKCTNKVQFPDK